MNQKINEIEVNGIAYVPKSTAVSHDGEIKICILQRGWVFVGYFSKDTDGKCSLTNAKNIRVWGTTKGLTELVNGVTEKTILDDCSGVVEFDWMTTVAVISVNQEAWVKLL